ncbi:MAG: hypothetical protein ABI972_09490 [Acidobacteriota bacterium]
MAQAATTLPHITFRDAAEARVVPWYLWCAVAAVTCAMVGIHWDISWHRTIGRDSFLTPAHVMVYLCGVLAGISCGYLILATTFQTNHPLRDSSVRMWGFRGPLGAFIASWGGVAMLTSAPFDDWWHNAYGLDVRIISPPHTVLALGMFGVMLGTVLLVLGRMNRAEGVERRRLEWLYLYVAGMTVVNVFTFIMETTPRVLQHSAVFYRNICIAVPFFLVSLARSSGRRWACTEISAVYMAFWLMMNWILPLFPAEPKLGPVYYQVTHFVPSNFPIWLIVPAFLLDLLFAWKPHWPNWKTALTAGPLILAGLVAAQWPFSMFLNSKAAWNWFFYANNFDYNTRPASYTLRNLYYVAEKTPQQFWIGMAIALAAAILTSWLGLQRGEFLKRVKR